MGDTGRFQRDMLGAFYRGDARLPLTEIFQLIACAKR